MLVGIDFDGNVPFYYKPWFLIFLNFIGLAHVTLILTLYAIPGANRFSSTAKYMKINLSKILLF
jgi:hypothetical protein